MNQLSTAHYAAVAQLTGPGAPFEIIVQEINGVQKKAFKNAARSVIDVLAPGRSFGDKLFLQYQGDSYTFNEFFDAADRLSVALQTEFGIQQGDRIAIAMRNRPEWVIALVAIVNIGAVTVPLNSWGKGEELQQGLEDSDAVLLICDADRFHYVREAGNNLRAIVVEPDAHDSNSVHFWPLVSMQDKAAFKPASAEPNDPFLQLFTSGTSGRPKGALFSHANCCQALMNVDFIGAATYMTNTEKMSKQMASTTPPKTLFAVPLFHISGLFSQFMTNLRHGRSMYMMYKWDSKEAARLIKEENITVLMGAPAMMLDLTQHEDFQDVDTSEITNVSAGGSATPEKLHQLYQEKISAAMAGVGWGLTETGGTGAAATGQAVIEHPESSGFPSPIVEFQFCDEDGNTVPDGEPGEIWVKSSVCIDRYYSGAKDSSDFRDGWFKTGDVGYISEDGLLIICDRVKDMIIRGGENIYPVEVENCLIQFPGCQEAAVIAVPDEKYGEVPACVVRMTDDHKHITGEDLLRFCKEHLAGFKVPTRVVFTSEPLPRTATEKLVKAAIKRQYFS